MLSPESELIWQGLVHLGDEPGVYSHAQYSGLCFELPMTVQSQTNEIQEVSLLVHTEDVRIYEGYKGHKVTLTRFDPDRGTSNQFDFKETIILEEYITEKSPKALKFKLQDSHVFISLKIEIDTQVAPGLYDEFLFTRILFHSVGYQYYASLGFRNLS